MEYKDKISGKKKLGIEAFARAMLVIPKTLAQNSGLDQQDTILKLLDADKASKSAIGLNIQDGEPLSPEALGIFDNYCVKKQLLNIAPTLAE